MKKEKIIQMMKDDIVWYALPRNMSVMKKEQLITTYNEAVRLNLTK